MKILGVSILILVVLSGLSIVANTYLGFNLKNSIIHSLNPFIVKDVSEFVFFLVLLAFLFVGPIKDYFQKRKKGSNKNKKQQQP